MKLLKNKKNKLLPFAEASFEGPFPWQFCHGQWHGDLVGPEPEWQHRGPTEARQDRSSRWSWRLGSRGQQTAGDWLQAALGAPARIGPCRRALSCLLGYCLFNKWTYVVIIWLRILHLFSKSPNNIFICHNSWLYWTTCTYSHQCTDSPAMIFHSPYSLSTAMPGQ